MSDPLVPSAEESSLVKVPVQLSQAWCSTSNMATAGSYYAPTPDSSTRSGAQYMKDGAAQAPYGIDIPPTPGDEPSYKGAHMFADRDKSGEWH